MATLAAAVWPVIIDWICVRLPDTFQHVQYGQDYEGPPDYKASVRQLKVLSLVSKAFFAFVFDALWSNAFVRIKSDSQAERFIKSSSRSRWALGHIVFHHEKGANALQTSSILRILVKTPNLTTIHLRANIADDWEGPAWSALTKRPILANVRRFTYRHSFGLEEACFGVKLMLTMPNVRRADLFYAGAPILNNAKSRIEPGPVDIPSLRELTFFGFEVSNTLHLPFLFSERTIKGLVILTNDDWLGLVGRDGSGKKLLTSLREITMRGHWHGSKYEPQLNEFAGLPRLESIRLFVSHDAPMLAQLLAKLPRNIKSLRLMALPMQYRSIKIKDIVTALRGKSLAFFEYVVAIPERSNDHFTLSLDQAKTLVSLFSELAGVELTLVMSCTAFKELSPETDPDELASIASRLFEGDSELSQGIPANLVRHRISNQGHFLERIDTPAGMNQFILARDNIAWPMSVKEKQGWLRW